MESVAELSDATWWMDVDRQPTLNQLELSELSHLGQPSAIGAKNEYPGSNSTAVTSHHRESLILLQFVCIFKLLGFMGLERLKPFREQHLVVPPVDGPHPPDRRMD